MVLKFRDSLLIACVLMLLSGCVAPIIGGAVGAASVVAIHKRQSIKTRLEDVNLCNKILDELRANSEIIETSHVEVTAYFGTVLLVGQTPSNRLKQKIEAITNSVEGIKHLYNEVTIEQPTSSMARMKDSWLTTRVKAELLAQKDLHSGHIKVLTENHIVYLLGRVKRHQADLAVTATQKIKGVKGVVKVFQYTH
jgi:osmotically-inducible protein OsmY